MRTVLEILTLMTNFLQQKGVQHPRRQAEELLADVLGMKRMDLYMEHDRPLTDAELERSRSWLKRRAQGEPLQYISGEVDFFDCKFLVNPTVLIPRQETEILVDKISTELAKEEDLKNKTLWDVCCGSGCIGISLKKRFPDLTVVLGDISPEALKQAKLNAEHNSVEIECLEGDLLSPFNGRKCDYFVCNPPYIAESEYNSLDIEVRAHEPKIALVSGDTGIEFYERLAKELPSHLNPKGKAWFEMGRGQGESINRAFHAPCWRHSAVENDWSGQNRFFSLEIE